MVELTEQDLAIKRMADSGNIVAAFNIGKLYVQKGDAENGERYLKQAADQGHLGGLFKLGEFYMNTGKKEEARRYLGMAAQKGHKKAQELLQNL